MPVERYGSKTDVIVKLVLVFFIALLSFSIGTFVGKKFSDNQHKLAELEPSTHGSEVAAKDGHEPEAEPEGTDDTRGLASVNPNAHDVKPDKALSDDEIAKLAEEFVVDDEKAPLGAPAKLNDKNESGHTSTKNEVIEKAPEHAAVKPEALKPAQRMAEGKSPVVANPVVPTPRIPSSLPKEMAASPVGKLTVQVGSFKTEKEAQARTADLKGKGEPAFYVSAKVNGVTVYRVSIGLFTTKDEALAYQKILVEGKKVSSDTLIQKVSSLE